MLGAKIKILNQLDENRTANSGKDYANVRVKNTCFLYLILDFDGVCG